jgi:hypothetical protein
VKQQLDTSAALSVQHKRMQQKPPRAAQRKAEARTPKSCGPQPLATGAPQKDWKSDKLIAYAREQHEAIKEDGRRTATKYWRLGTALNLLRASPLTDSGNRRSRTFRSIKRWRLEPGALHERSATRATCGT